MGKSLCICNSLIVIILAPSMKGRLKKTKSLSKDVVKGGPSDESEESNSSICSLSPNENNPNKVRVSFVIPQTPDYENKHTRLFAREFVNLFYIHV